MILWGCRLKNKKVLWVLIAAVVVVAGISLAVFTGPEKTSDLGQVFTTQAVPGVEQYLSGLTGQKMKISWRSMDQEGGRLTLEKVAARPASGQGPALEMDQVVFTRLEPVFGDKPHWLASGEVVGLKGGLTKGTALKAGRISFEELRLRPGLAVIAIKSGRVVGFARDAASGRLTLAELRVGGLALHKAGRLDLASGTVAGFAFSQGAAGLKLAGLKIVGGRFYDLDQPSPLDAALTEMTGLQALNQGRVFLSVAEAVLKYDRPPNKHNLDLRLADLVITAKAAPTPLAEWLAAWQYPLLKAGLSLKVEVNLNSQTLVVNELKIASPQMGELDLGLELGGFRLDPSKLSRMTFFSAMLAQRSVALKQASVEYRDASLAGRMLAERARAHGLTVEQMKQRLTADLERVAGWLGAGFKPLHQALTAFINQPARLRVSLAPNPPLGLLGVTLLKPTELVERLGIEASAE